MEKRIYAILVILIAGSSVYAMEEEPTRKRPSETILEEQPRQKMLRLRLAPREEELPPLPQVSPAPTLAQLPAEIRKIILDLLLAAPGDTKQQRLLNAVSEIRKYIRLNRRLREIGLTHDFNEYIISELARLHTANNNKVEAALALGTQGAGAWLYRSLAQPDHEKASLLFRQANQAFLDAIRNGRLYQVRFLLHFVPNLYQNQLEIHRRSSERIRTRQGWQEVPVAGAGPYVLDSLQHHPLYIAINQGFENIALLLINHLPDSIYYLGINKDKILQAAAEKGLVEVVRRILSYSDGHIHVRARDSQGNNPLFYAARNLHEDIVTILLERGNAQEQISNENNEGFTVLARLRDDIEGGNYSDQQLPIVERIIQIIEEYKART